MAEILAFDPERTNNAQLMRDCKTLGYLDGVGADVTYNIGRFWRLVERPQFIFDIDPQFAEHGCVVADFRDLPLDDGVLDFLVLDPPYRLGGTPSTFSDETTGAPYGNPGSYKSIDSVHQRIHDGIDEAWRVLRVGGKLLLKVMPQQSCGMLNDQPGMFAERAVASGRWRDVDRLHVTGKPRKQRSQKTARQNTSTLVVLAKKRSRT